MQFTTLRQQAYEQLRDKLIAGELAGGAPLSEPSLAKELGMSRTPIREAIRQMEVEGLLEYAPRFGAVVRIPDAREVREMYTVREALESYAAAEAAERITDADLAALRAFLSEMGECIDLFRSSGETVLERELLQRFLTADMAFHKAVLAVADNLYISRILDTTGLLTRVFLTTHWQYDAENLAEANGFHEELWQALASGDPEGARRCTIAAMRVARENALRAMNEGAAG